MNTLVTDQEQLTANAQRMIKLLSAMRHKRLGPGSTQIKELNLSFSHMRALGMLWPDHVLPMKELAEQMQMTPPSVTALTRRLAQTGLVQLKRHAEDRRVTLLSLTPTGHALHQQLHEESVAQMALLLQGLSEQEQQQFLDLLERAVQAMQSEGE